MTATAGPGDMLRVTYSGRTVPVRDRQGNLLDTKEVEGPFTFMWDSRPFVCEPDQPTFVSFEAVTNALGDPRSGPIVQNLKDSAGNNQFIADRASEIRRLRAVYDNQFGSETELQYAPRCEVVDLDGDRILTVVDDPQGESVTPAQTTLLDRDALMAQIERQNRMIQTLAKEQGIDLSSPEIVNEPAPEADMSTDVPEDKGTKK